MPSPANPASRFCCEPYHVAADTIRIKVTCSRCGATSIGNVDEIVEWENKHRCAAMTAAA